MAFSLYQGVIVVSSQITHAHMPNIHPLLGTCAFIFSAFLVPWGIKAPVPLYPNSLV